MNSIYGRILDELNQRNITGKELGKLLGLKKSPLTDWKNGKSKPTLEQIIKTCDIFALSADYLLFGKRNNNLSPDETNLITLYHKLSQEDQSEILSIIELKLQRNHQSDFSPKNSTSNNTSV